MKEIPARFNEVVLIATDWSLGGVPRVPLSVYYQTYVHCLWGMEDSLHMLVDITVFFFVSSKNVNGDPLCGWKLNELCLLHDDPGIVYFVLFLLLVLLILTTTTTIIIIIFIIIIILILSSKSISFSSSSSSSSSSSFFFSFAHRVLSS